MCMLNVYELIGFAFLCAWFAHGLIDMSTYDGILGPIKLKLAKLLASDIQLNDIEAIITNPKMSLEQQANMIDEHIYIPLIKKYRFFKLTMCSYCLGIQLYLWSSLIYLYTNEINLILIFPVLFVGIAAIYFILTIFS